MYGVILKGILLYNVEINVVLLQLIKHKILADKSKFSMNFIMFDNNSYEFILDYIA
jgi:hypothetical protein